MRRKETHNIRYLPKRLLLQIICGLVLPILHVDDVELEGDIFFKKDESNALGEWRNGVAVSLSTMLNLILERCDSERVGRWTIFFGNTRSEFYTPVDSLVAAGANSLFTS